MKPDKQHELFKAFPEVFKIRNKTPPPYYAIHYGIHTNGDGWDQLVFDLCAQLEPLIKELPDSIRQECGAIQVKEKYGQLRFYVPYGKTDKMTQAINQAEEKSLRICESCGLEGQSFKNRGSYHTLCLKCQEIHKRKL